jgi:hypothetical protein
VPPATGDASSAQATAAEYLPAGGMPVALADERKTYGDRGAAMGTALKREMGDAIEFTQPKAGAAGGTNHGFQSLELIIGELVHLERDQR